MNLGARRDPRAHDEQRDPDIRLVRQHLLNRDPELPQVVAMVAREEKVRAVEQTGILDSLVQPGYQVVYRKQHPTPLAHQVIDVGDHRVTEDRVGGEQIEVIHPELVEVGGARGRDGQVVRDCLVPRRRFRREVWTGCADKDKERVPGCGGLLNERDRAAGDDGPDSARAC